jgi:nucleoside-diphosphate-sugar epimerase
MRVFVTGATGFVGSFIVPELISAGHEVVGLSRSDTGAEALVRAGAKVVRGDVNDLETLRHAAEATDGIIHTAFNHDTSGLKQHSENDRMVIATLGATLAGTDRPLIITSGTGLVQSVTGRPVRETDHHVTSAVFPRAASEEAADALIDQGGNVIVMRLPQVHDPRRQGRIGWHIQIAREQGRVAYVGEGRNRVPAVHVCDAARLFRLVLESGQAGARYHGRGRGRRAPARDRRGGRGRPEVAGRVDHTRAGPGLLRLAGPAGHAGSARLQHLDPAAAGLVPHRPGPAGRPTGNGL